MKIIVGGLGGGGDVGLALIVAFSLGLRGFVVASFSKCRSASIEAKRIHGALVRPHPGRLGKRFFEDKLDALGVDPGRVYVICTRDSFPSVVDALEWVVEEYSPVAGFFADIGETGYY